MMCLQALFNLIKAESSSRDSAEGLGGCKMFGHIRSASCILFRRSEDFCLSVFPRVRLRTGHLVLLCASRIIICLLPMQPIE